MPYIYAATHPDYGTPTSNLAGRTALRKQSDRVHPHAAGVFLCRPLSFHQGGMMSAPVESSGRETLQPPPTTLARAKLVLSGLYVVYRYDTYEYNALAHLLHS